MCARIACGVKGVWREGGGGGAECGAVGGYAAWAWAGANYGGRGGAGGGYGRAARAASRPKGRRAARARDLMYLRSPFGSPLPKILKLSSRLKDELVTPERFFQYLETDTEDETLVGEQRARLADYARALLVYEREKRKQGTLDYGDQI